MFYFLSNQPGRETLAVFNRSDLQLAVFTTHSFALAPRLTSAVLIYLLLQPLDLRFIFFLVLRRIVLFVV